VTGHDPLDALRDLLPPGELAELEAAVAEVQQEAAAMTPAEIRRLERKAAREQAQQEAALAVYRRMRGNALPPADPSSCQETG
jgi:uncharacterized small protein (DUF1192 family)